MAEPLGKPKHGSASFWIKGLTVDRVRETTNRANGRSFNRFVLPEALPPRTSIRSEIFSSWWDKTKLSFVSKLALAIKETVPDSR